MRKETDQGIIVAVRLEAPTEIIVSYPPKVELFIATRSMEVVEWGIGDRERCF